MGCDEAYKLGRGNISQGRLSTYDQFLKQEGKEKNIAFLKNGYGIGGGSDAIPESGYWESHDGKGIKIYKGIGDDQKSVAVNKIQHFDVVVPVYRT